VFSEARLRMRGAVFAAASAGHAIQYTRALQTIARGPNATRRTRIRPANVINKCLKINFILCNCIYFENYEETSMSVAKNNSENISRDNAAGYFRLSPYVTTEHWGENWDRMSWSSG
jgi:hypothetical protein